MAIPSNQYAAYIILHIYNVNCLSAWHPCIISSFLFPSIVNKLDLVPKTDEPLVQMKVYEISFFDTFLL